VRRVGRGEHHSGTRGERRERREALSRWEGWPYRRHRPPSSLLLPNSSLVQVYYEPFVMRMFTEFDAAKKAKEAGNQKK
jgi:hypothetical protein